MNATTTAKTHFEDWQDRRQYIESQGGDSFRNALQIKVLDYLISRYRNSAAAHQPARFALRRDLHWNDRRITVHHHLGRGEVAGVQNREDAEQRIADLVQRMMSDERSEDEGFTPTKLADTPRRPLVRLTPNWRIKLGWNADSQIRSALASYPILPEICLKHLVSRLTDVTREDTIALDLFLECKNRNIIECTVRAWRDRVAQGSSTGWITETLEARLRRPDCQPRAAELIRERLADDDARVRIAASRLIAEMGDLDDIGLLSDLLALPQSSDENPIERDAITTAMRTIAEKNMNTQTTVYLYELDSLALIVPASTNVVYQNQTGGHACIPCRMEGFLVPFAGEMGDAHGQLRSHFTGPKWGGWCSERIDEETADEIDSILAGHARRSEIVVDRTKLNMSWEAWVHVRITRTLLALVEHATPSSATLTWSNSD